MLGEASAREVSVHQRPKLQRWPAQLVLDMRSGVWPAQKSRDEEEVCVD